jgi:hypothetical protein
VIEATANAIVAAVCHPACSISPITTKAANTGTRSTRRVVSAFAMFTTGMTGTASTDADAGPAAASGIISRPWR